jgi:GNAT superfamily N-acetyltransferase
MEERFPFGYERLCSRPVEWSDEEKRREAIRAPIGSHIPRPEVTLVVREGWVQITATDLRDGTCNEVLESRLTEEEADAVIDRTIAHYASKGLAFRWVVGPYTTPADMGARLERRGFVRWAARAMSCDPRSARIAVAPGVRVVEAGEREIDDWCRVCAEGWGSEDRMTRYRALLSTPERKHRLFLAYDGDVPAATAAYVTHPRSAYLIGGVVLPAHRGRGLYRALVRARLDDAAARGYTLATTLAREKTSAPILERLGFETACHFTMYASGGPTP